MKKMLSRKEYEKWFNAYKGDCMLCDLDKQFILREYKHWLWIVNIAPYWRYHTMVIPRRHILHLSEIRLSEWTEFRIIYEDVIGAYREAKFKHANGTDIVKYLIMIRARDYNLDHSQDIKRPDHLHIHFLPDAIGKLDPLLEEQASEIPLEEIYSKLL